MLMGAWLTPLTPHEISRRQSGVEAAGKAAKGVGSAVQRL